jgi:pimeloyl-ACP methyl ester carboxylesterase
MSKLNKKIWLTFITAFLLICFLIGVFFENSAKKQALVDFPPIGKLIDIGDRKIHLDCRGEGSPIVVFESGLDTSGSLSWSLIHDAIANSTRACAYDRAGMMWSDMRSITGEQLGKAIAEDLNKTLVLAGEKPPYVLVGHSFGGPYITIFTKYFGSSVAGLVFVDTSHPDQISIFKEFKEPLLNRFSYVVMDFFEPIWAYVGLTRYFAQLNDGKHTNQSIKDEQTIDAYSPSSGLALTQESRAYEQTLNEAGSFRNFGNRPLFVIGAIANYDQMSDDELIEYGIKRKLLSSLKDKDLFTHEDQASWSTKSELKMLYNADHYIQFEQPKIVINSILSVVQRVRLNGT